MTPFSDVCTGVPGVLIDSAAMLLTISQLAALIFSLQIVRSRTLTALSALHALVGIVFLILLMYSGNEQFRWQSGELSALHGISAAVFAVPWLCYPAAELLSAAVLFWQLCSLRRCRKTHLAPDAIKEALDWLPAAVCIADEDGTVLLSNLKMNELAQSITGKPLTDLRRFWETVTAQGEQQDAGYIVSAEHDRCYLFTQAPLVLPQAGASQTFVRCIASDMTEKYRIRQELSDKNKHLTEVQARMKSVAAREHSLIAAREIMHARMAVHDQMGGLLLSAKYFLDHPENMDESQLLDLLKYNNSFLLGAAEQSEQKHESLHEAMQDAKKIGVTVIIKGTLPADAAGLSLIAQAIGQCAANTVRHAGGNRLTAVLTEQESQMTAVFTNNGRPPASPVKETGGLAMLRTHIEQAGGSMTIESEPVFRLTVTIPKHE